MISWFCLHGGRHDDTCCYLSSNPVKYKIEPYDHDHIVRWCMIIRLIFCVAYGDHIYFDINRCLPITYCLHQNGLKVLQTIVIFYYYWYPALYKYTHSCPIYSHGSQSRRPRKFIGYLFSFLTGYWQWLFNILLTGNLFVYTRIH